MYRDVSRQRRSARHDCELQSLSRRLQDVAADTSEALAYARDLQTKLYSMALSVLKAASQLERARR
jgi:hypothetical protein